MKLQIYTMKIYIGNLLNDPGKTPKGKPVEESSLFIFAQKNQTYIFSRKFQTYLFQKFLDFRATTLPRKPCPNLLYGIVRAVLNFCACTKICTVRNCTKSVRTVRTFVRTSKIVSFLSSKIVPTLFCTVASICMSISIVRLPRFACCTVSQFWTKFSANSRFACKKIVLGFVQIPNSEICPLLP